MASASGTEEAIRRKLLIDGEGLGDDRRFSTLLKLTVKLFAPDLTPESGQICRSKIQSLLEQSELTAKKCHLVHRANQRECDRYGVLSGQIESETAEAEAKIGRSRMELEEARQIRRHRQEYDAIANVIKLKPNRAETLQKIAEVEAKLKDSRTQRADLAAKIDLRRRQFHVVMVSLDELSRMITAEDSNKGESSRGGEETKSSGSVSVAPSEDEMDQQ